MAGTDIDFDALFAEVVPKVETKVRGKLEPVSREVAEAPMIIDDIEDVKEVQVESEGVSEAVITEESEDKFVGQVEIKRIDYRDEKLDPLVDPAKEPYHVDAICEVTSNIIHGNLMGRDEVINQLESGNIPIEIDDRDYVKWTSDVPDIAESVLMWLLDIKEDRNIKEEVDHIIDTQCDTAVGKMAVNFYAKMVDYDEDLLEPILKLNSFYFSAVEDSDIMDITFKKRQIDLLESIDNKLGKLLDK